MNLLNYIDRYSFFAVGTQIKRRASTSTTTGTACSGASFMIVYTIVSPLMGWLGDRYNRRMLLAGGVGALEPGDGRDGVLAQTSTTCSSGGPCWASARRVTA